jgi:nitrite reductase (NADH) small subunit
VIRHFACKLSELPEGRGKLVEVGETAVALFRVGDAVYALENTCPHREGPLAFGDLKGGVVYCPLHAWPFELATGQCLDVPAARLRTFPVHVEGDAVEIEL